MNSSVDIHERRLNSMRDFWTNVKSMRYPIAALMLACAMALPALCQTEPDTYPDTWQARELQACGAPEKEVHYTVDTDKDTHPLAMQSADKALIYIFRPLHGMTSFPSNIAVDGEWKGANLAGTYFFFTLEPGLHYICSSAKSRRLLIFTAEAGKTYYLEQQVIFKPHSPVHNLFLFGEADGKSLLARTTPSTWKIK
jgi:hypothetical protein